MSYEIGVDALMEPCGTDRGAEQTALLTIQVCAKPLPSIDVCVINL